MVIFFLWIPIGRKILKFSFFRLCPFISNFFFEVFAMVKKKWKSILYIEIGGVGGLLYCENHAFFGMFFSCGNQWWFLQEIDHFWKKTIKIFFFAYGNQWWFLQKIDRFWKKVCFVLAEINGDFCKKSLKSERKSENFPG